MNSTLKKYSYFHSKKIIVHCTLCIMHFFSNFALEYANETTHKYFSTHLCNAHQHCNHFCCLSLHYRIRQSYMPNYRKQRTPRATKTAIFSTIGTQHTNHGKQQQTANLLNSNFGKTSIATIDTQQSALICEQYNTQHLTREQLQPYPILQPSSSTVLYLCTTSHAELASALPP